MAIANFRINHLKVSSGRGASRVVQYLIREGKYAPKQAQVEYLTRTSQATTERDDLVHQETANLPAWAHGDAAGFFARAEQHERANGRWGTTWQLALPKELDREAQLTLARDFLAAHLRNHPHLWVMHDPVNTQGEHQPHIHILFSERTNDVLERKGPVDYFKRPDAGGCVKDRWFSQRSHVTEIRAAWCDAVNFTLERAGHETRVHPSSLYRRGIDRKPEPKVGPSQDRAAQAERERIRQQRDAAREQAQAAAGWEARKTKLGITDVHRITPQEFVQGTRHRARNVQPGQWVPGMPSAQVQQQARGARQQAHREQQVRTLKAEIHILTARQESAREKRTEAQKWERLEQPLIGNVNSQIYHVPGDHNYGDVVPQNQIYFWSHGEAEEAGYRQAKNQHYGQGTETPMADRLRAARERRERERALRQALSRGRKPWDDEGRGRSGLRAHLYEEEPTHGRHIG